MVDIYYYYQIKNIDKETIDVNIVETSSEDQKVYELKRVDHRDFLELFINRIHSIHSLGIENNIENLIRKYQK
ncbi:MAG: hypothetical protein J7K22_01325 [Nanoarchaeota archaeon]|nr:hypothetical protein [Nanoarchaeota archaeon]